MFALGSSPNRKRGAQHPDCFNEKHAAKLFQLSSDNFLKLFTTELQMVLNTIESALPVPDVAEVKVTTVRPTKI